jgi:hypothetical protein
MLGRASWWNPKQSSPSHAEDTDMSVSLQALFYFLALACFVGAAVSFTASRRGFASRVNLLALGLAFWVFVPFMNALLRVD